MKDETVKLIQLISENKSIKEITTELNLSKRQLFQRMSMLRQTGYLIEKIYSYDGNIKYRLGNPFKNKKSNVLDLGASSNMSSIRLVGTADSHYGNIKENLICRDKTFDYCTKEGINLIFHLGDIFEGVIPGTISQQKYGSVQEQIEQFIDNYPLVDNILTVALLGNHDASFWLDAGIDIKTVLENKRHDIIPIGYEKGEVSINNFVFSLNHPIERINSNNFNQSQSCKIFFYGHSHRFKIINNQNGLAIFIPSSSNIVDEKNICFLGTGIPSILDIEFLIKNNSITTAIIKQYILYNNELIKIGEFEENVQISEDKAIKYKRLSTPLSPKMFTCFPPIEENKNDLDQLDMNKNQSLKKKKLTLGTKFDKYKGLSQTEKFNARFNNK